MGQACVSLGSVLIWGCPCLLVRLGRDPDHRKDLKSRSPNLGPYTTNGYFQGALFGDLFFRSIRWSGDEPEGKQRRTPQAADHSQ